MLNTFITYNLGKIKKTLGRGIASGQGKTSGKGTKGQKARSGISLSKFEGGQTALFKRLPKRGQKSKKYFHVKIITTYSLFLLIAKRKLTHNILLQDVEKLRLINLKKEKLKLLRNKKSLIQMNIEINFVSRKLIKNICQQGFIITVVS